MAIDIVARALAVSGKQNLSNYYTKTESDERYVKKPVDPEKWSALAYDPLSKDNVYYPMDSGATKSTIPYREFETNNFKVGDITSSDDSGYVANKKYVDDSIGKVFSVTIYEAGD